MTEEAIYEQAWLEARANVTSILVQHGILDTRNDIAGFWSHDGFGNSTWLSIYDLMEANK
jgi:hypothetical protein